MNARDHANLRTRLKTSATELCLLDWDGRVWIDGWQDTKWINMRATPRKLSNGVIIWDGIMLNITQSKNERFQLEQSRRDLADLTAHINTIREDERKKIAREIHDDLGGNLTAIKMGLSSIIDQPKSDPKAMLKHTKGLLSVVDNTFEAVHRISGNLRPNILDLGIVDALSGKQKSFRSNWGFHVCLHLIVQRFPLRQNKRWRCSVSVRKPCRISLNMHRQQSERRFER